MKKFMKGSAITAAVLLIIGFVLSIITVSVRGTITLGELMDAVTHGKVDIAEEKWEWMENRFYNSHIPNWLFGHIWLPWDWGDSFYGDLVRADSLTDFDSRYDIYKGDVNKYEVGSSSVRNLDLEIAGCMFFVETSENGRFYAEAYKLGGSGRFQAYEEDGTLHVRADHPARRWSDVTNCSVTLYVPLDYRFDKVEAEAGAGNMYLGTMNAGEIEASVGAGEMSVDSLKADKLKVEAGAGNIDISNMDVEELEVHADAGTAELYGTIRKYAELECSAGSLTLELTGKPGDYNYNVNNDMGSVEVDGRYYGESSWNRFQNGAPRDIDIDCSVGNVSIIFTE